MHLTWPWIQYKLSNFRITKKCHKNVNFFKGLFSCLMNLTKYFQTNFLLFELKALDENCKSSFFEISPLLLWFHFVSLKTWYLDQLNWYILNVGIGTIQLSMYPKSKNVHFLMRYFSCPCALRCTELRFRKIRSSGKWHLQSTQCTNIRCGN